MARSTFQPARRRRFSAVAVIVAMAAAVLSLVASAAPAHAVGSGNALKTWAATMSGNQPVTDAGAVTDAQNFDLIVANLADFSQSQVTQMHAANPSVKVLMYLNGAYAQDPNQAPGTCTTYPCAPGTGGFPQSWYARDGDGKYVQSTDQGNWLMDVTNPNWIQTRIDLCSSDITSKGADGCYLDVLGNASVTPGFVTGVPIDPRTNQLWTIQDWMTDTANLGAQVKAAESPKMVVGNGLQNGDEYFDPSQGPTSKLFDPVNAMDGANAQGWVRGTGQDIDHFDATADWLNDVNMLRSPDNKGKSVMTMTRVWNLSPAPSQAQIDGAHRFALASFLLGTDGNQYFLFDSNPNDGAAIIPHPYDNVNIGGITGPYSSFAANAYVRYFTHGVALVNDDATNSVTYNLGALYTDLDGKQMTSVTLPPHTGSVLTPNWTSSTVVSPPSIPADGVSTATATTTITDSNGHGISGQTVTFTSSGDVTFGPVTDNNDGTYSAVVTASRTPDFETITSHDGILTSSAILQEQWPSSTALKASPTSFTAPRSVTFTATVSSPAGSSSGTVDFFDGGASVGSADLVSGRATLTIGTLGPGGHVITASYRGTPTVAPSTSPAVFERVYRSGAATSRTKLASSLRSSTAGQPVTLNATVTGRGGVPTGVVWFFDNGALIGQGTLDSAGHVVLTTTALTVGRHKLTAGYSGDGTFNPSIGARSFTVKP